MTCPVPSPVALPGSNKAAPPSFRMSLKWPAAKPTNRPSNASSHDMAASRRRASSCRCGRPTTNYPQSKACGQINSTALPLMPALKPVN